MSLVELLVAITIGALLLTGAVSLLVNNKRVYRTQNEMGRVQENARFAIERLLYDISMSGYFGCSGDSSLITNNVDLTNSGDLYDVANFLEGFDNGASTWRPSGDSTTEVVNSTNVSPLSGTDGIAIRNMSGSTFNLQEPLIDNVANDVYVDADSGIKADDVVVISDCKSTDVFKVSAMTEIDDSPADGVTDKLKLTHKTPENTSVNLGNEYNSTTTNSGKLSTTRYFIAQGDKGSGLFRNGVELVEGISDMEILYGINTDTDPDTVETYSSAGSVSAANWSNVVSVKLTLTFNIIDRDYSDTTPTPWVYTTTVRIRNNAI